jgi:hypothetical protein
VYLWCILPRSSAVVKAFVTPPPTSCNEHSEHENIPNLRLNNNSVWGQNNGRAAAIGNSSSCGADQTLPAAVYGWSTQLWRYGGDDRAPDGNLNCSSWAGEISQLFFWLVGENAWWVFFFFFGVKLAGTHALSALNPPLCLPALTSAAVCSYVSFLLFQLPQNKKI